MKELVMDPRVEACIQGLVLKKTIETISFGRRRGFDLPKGHEEEPETLVKERVNFGTNSALNCMRQK